MSVFEYPPGSLTQPYPHVPFVADWDNDGDTDIYGWGYLGMHRFDNRALYGVGCPGSAGIPVLTLNDPSVGNGAFSISVWSGAPNAGAVLGISVVQTPTTACGLSIGVLPTELLLPMGALGFTTLTLSGTASMALPIPVVPALHGVHLFAQWAIADPAGAFSFGGANYALSRGRTIILW
jgi:hypothetical protein